MSKSQNIKKSTLVIVHNHPRVLLGMKKRGFGEGKWNGFGGKVQEGETIEDAARRELLEEVGVNAVSMDKHGVLRFTIAGEDFLREVHVFKVREFTGEPIETEEMRPAWFLANEIPFHDMWPDDIHWFPFFLNDQKFIGNASFSENHVMQDWEFKEVDLVRDKVDEL